ncbi:MAG TPA: hypothetical protein VEA16_15165 [Vicinamibacterales bacterium]|nr:hypothetical protein [Vicinamibacterales bacterium]
MLEINHTWTSTGSTSGWNTPVYLDFPADGLALYCSASTVATTNSFQLQTAISSGGPWITEGSTSMSATANAASLDVLRFTGPHAGWVRPVSKTVSTGTYTFKLVGLS